MTVDGICFVVKTRIDRERRTSPADRIRKVALMQGLRSRKRMAKVVSRVPIHPIADPSSTSVPSSAGTRSQGSEQDVCPDPPSQTPAANTSVASTIAVPEPDPTSVTTSPEPDADSTPSDGADDDTSSFADENGFDDHPGGLEDESELDGVEVEESELDGVEDSAPEVDGGSSNAEYPAATGDGISFPITD